MQLSAAVLAALISQCAPDVSPDTMNALIMTESGANPYVIANVSDGTSKYFKDEKGLPCCDDDKSAFGTDDRHLEAKEDKPAGE